MGNNKTIITGCKAIRTVNNFKKFYHAFIKFNNIKIDKTIIIAFLKELFELEDNFCAYNHFRIFPLILKL